MNRAGEGNTLAETSTASQAATRIAFEKALNTLTGLPLTTPAIRTALGEAAVGWQALLAGAVNVHHPTGRTDLAQALCDRYETRTLSPDVMERATRIAANKYGTTEWLMRR